VTLDEQKKGLDEASATIERIRARMAEARGRNRVELHVSLDDIAVLVQFADAAAKAYAKVLRAKSECPVSSDGRCYPETDGHCHWCDRECM
jgi:ATP-dependent exoDNAse (exonuclease V) beta subunit